MSKIVIYHGSCYDGFTAAWVAYRELGLENVEYYPALYGAPPPKIDGRDVLMVDFSYPRSVMEYLMEDANDFTCLDHHKTAEENLRGLPGCWFDMEKSGCRLAWEYFHQDLEPPRLLLYVEDRDLWRFKYGDATNLAYAYLTSVPMDFPTWDYVFLTKPHNDVLGDGLIIREYIARSIEKTVQEVRLGRIGEHVVAVLNTSYQNISETLTAAIEIHATDFAVGWFQRRDGKVQFSLRSRGEVDVSVIARSFGGGGHKSAAGFEMDLITASAYIFKWTHIGNPKP